METVRDGNQYRKRGKKEDIKKNDRPRNSPYGYAYKKYLTVSDGDIEKDGGKKPPPPATHSP